MGFKSRAEFPQPENFFLAGLEVGTEPQDDKRQETADLAHDDGRTQKAVVVGEVRSLLALVILGLGSYLKARKEEVFRLREFGAGFEAHAKHTGMFLPRV